jgi:hypothetical protein
MDFYLGTHHSDWLAKTDVPLFLSRRRLAGRRRLPVARGPWVLDSGGFTELSTYGRWTVTADEYVREVRRYAGWIGNLRWVATMDWMTEPLILRKTGLTVADHQRNTVENYLTLRSKAPELPWVPVLQGWTITEYWQHVEQYRKAGIDLAALPLVGVGSVCRRQGTVGAAAILRTLAAMGLHIHAFGVKASGLKRLAGSVASADSLAWSYAARRRPPLPECAGGTSTVITACGTRCGGESGCCEPSTSTSRGGQGLPCSVASSEEAPPRTRRGGRASEPSAGLLPPLAIRHRRRLLWLLGRDIHSPPQHLGGHGGRLGVVAAPAFVGLAGALEAGF